VANSVLPALYACDGGTCDREVRIYRATPLPENGSTHELNCFLLLDRLVLHPCVHIHGDRRAAADLFGDSGTNFSICRATSLNHIRLLVHDKNVETNS